jgi:hypothetical protein
VGFVCFFYAALLMESSNAGESILANAVRSSAARALRAAFYLDWRTECCYFRGRHWPRLSDIGHPIQPETQPQLLYCATFPKPEKP